MLSRYISYLELEKRCVERGEDRGGGGGGGRRLRIFYILCFQKEFWETFLRGNTSVYPSALN